MEPSHRLFVSTEVPFVVPHGRSTNKARLNAVWNAADLVTGCRLRDAPPEILRYPPEFCEPKTFSSCVMTIRTEDNASQQHADQERNDSSTRGALSSSASVLMNVTPRNDLVLSIKRRVRRIRNAATGEIISTEVVEEAFQWVGCVSRAMSIARPSDFVVFPGCRCSSLSAPGATQMLQTSAEDGLRAPPSDPTRLSVVRQGDMFAPRSFLSERCVATFPYRYQSRAKTPGETVRAGADATMTTTLGAPSSGEPGDDAGGRNVAVVVKAPAIHSTDVTYPPPRGLRFPPQPSGPQREYLSRLPPNFPAYRVVSELLAKRPIWRRSDLLRAVSATGLAPFAEANKNIIHSLTYSITKGPFQRLRVAYGSDPTTSSARYAVYQRLAIRVMRTSRLGVAIRDAARVPGVRDLLLQYIHDESNAPGSSAGADEGRAMATSASSTTMTTASSVAPSQEPYCPQSSMPRFVISVLSSGSLFALVQVVDLMDDSVFSQEAHRFIDTFDAKHGGYYTEESLQKLADRVHECILHTATVVLPAALKRRDANNKDRATASSNVREPDEADDVLDDHSSLSTPSAVVSDVDDEDAAFIGSGDDRPVPSSRKRNRSGRNAPHADVFGGEYGEGTGSETESE